MYTRSVSRNAARRLGKLITAMMLMLIGLVPLGAAQITITVTGTSNGIRDRFHIFAPKDITTPVPFTLVFTFDDAKGATMKGNRCTGSGSGIAGGNGGSPGTAVLTMNGKSYTFGTRKDARSRTWRSIDSLCSHSEIGIAIEEGSYPLTSGVNIKIHPNPGKHSLTQDNDWRGSVSLKDFDARNGDNAFMIRQPGNFGAQTVSYLSVETLTVKGTGKTLGLW